MSKPSSIFSYSPMKNVRSSPASGRSNGPSKTKNQQVSSTIAESSPRKCRIQTEVRSSPAGTRNTNINVTSRLQITDMSSKMNKQRPAINPSPRKEQSNEDKRDTKKPTSGSKLYSVSGVVKLRNARDNKPTSRRGLFEGASDSSDIPANINVKTMRSCFERKENRVPAKPPPSPSPSRAKPQLSNMRNNDIIKGILSSKSRFDQASPSKFRPSTPTSQHKLRRSVSTGTLAASTDSPARPSLLRSHSQNMMTPKHRVRFEDEATPGCFSPVLLDTQSVVGETTNLTVAVRLRPTFPGERSVVTVDDGTVRVHGLGSEHCFSYDYCFDSNCDQQQVFDTMVQPLVDAAFHSYNVCLFAYGQTGSGKSYSMMGEEIKSIEDVPEKAGIIPRFSKQIFNTVEGSKDYLSAQIEISYFEIYNEKIHDLLRPSEESGRAAPLRVREHPEMGPYVVDLTVRKVCSFRSLQDWLRIGNSHKATAATEMNVNSSRSHSIFTITLTQSQDDDRPSVCSKINLVDLAGSERLAHTCASGDRLKASSKNPYKNPLIQLHLKEGVSINRSLLTLGKVISSLAENKRGGFIPYRESVITWLLRESLGGNSHTAMLATISPSSQYVDETLSTLRYACQARSIVNTVRINERPHERMIRELKQEVQRLKEDNRSVDHKECDQKLLTLQEHLDRTTKELAKAKIFCDQSEKEILKLEKEWEKTKVIDFHEYCNQKIQDLENELALTENRNKKLDREIKELKKDCSEVNEDKYEYEIQIRQLKGTLEDLNERYNRNKEELCRLENELEENQKENKQLKAETNKLKEDLCECSEKNHNYERDISEMKNNMLEIKNNFNHNHCDSQILMLQTALCEAERFTRQYQEIFQTLEKKCTEMTTQSNHEGCEKEISTLKETINELKQFADHGKCDKVIEKLKSSLTESEKILSDLQDEIIKFKEENSKLETVKERSHKEILSLKKELMQLSKTASHTECEEKLDTLRKAVAVARSMNVHIQCENRISELEKEVRTLQSVAQSDHNKYKEKIDGLFYAVEKYADENSNLTRKHEAEISQYIDEKDKLIKTHKEEVNQYVETIQSLEDELSALKAELEDKKNIKHSYQDVVYLESQLRSVKDENSKLKKKKVEDEKRISSMEQQVISLTKELLEVKNQLRASVRAKESSESLCTQLQEQLSQQDRKLALSKSSSQIEDDKENWETPSKVIRRSIAQHSKSNRSARCSFVLKAEEIHQSLKDAEDICSRLKIPWVFQLEPEVTTHSWFDVNVRVWDQRTMSSVRWPQDVFLGWLREMKDTILSKTRGHKLFHSATWMQNSQDPKPLPLEPVPQNNKKPCIEQEVDSLRSRIMALERLVNIEDKHEALSAVSSLGKAVTQLSSQLGLSSPVKSQQPNTRRRL
ncbi:chromosome-associated kinesin KIF4A-like [Macrosteles quadrilineatus]|uniref:chromosome-associated kinesin KIF4A-like n=1 Tax=Macrosteles quadrilineatus TaxID=74068 RepID=UPI0023E133DA|nr:chromosome-associated kinesin KIF4A-like [Macrosteles quadrilineatus]